MIDKDISICIIIVDALRADHLSCYGYEHQTSPNIDAVSKNSVLFHNAISQSNWTYSSLYSLISGRYPSVHRITWFDQIINGSFITLPEILQEHGYHTAIFSSFKTLINPSTFGKHFKETRLMNIDEDPLQFMSNWFKKNRRSFSIFHIGDYVHEPYFADKKYIDMFYDGGYEDLKFDDTLNSLISTYTKGLGDKMRDINRKLNLRIKRLTKKQLSYVIACYDAGIYYVDKFIGRFYEILRSKIKNYLFIITADHGQCFFEHGFYGHGLHLFDEVIRVPLIVDMNQDSRGIIIEPTQHIDIFPTILELLGLESEIKKLDGIPFTQVFSSKGTELNNRFAISESHPFISIQNKTHKLITTHFRLQKNESRLKELYSNLKNKNIRRFIFNSYALLSPDKLYNIQKDTVERNNVKRQDKLEYKLLTEQLKTIFKNTQKEGLSPVTVSMEDDIKQQLRNLGYM